MSDYSNRDGRDRGDRDMGRDMDGREGEGLRQRGKRRFCRFCADQNAVIDYKDPQALRYFVTDRGKIVPRRISGTCACHQRKINKAIKQARSIALLPFTATGN